jgi:hypothetical protein
MYIENNPENSTLLVEAITVDPSSVTLPEMHKKTLSATVYPESVLNKEVEWSSSDTSIATVNSATGEVCAKKEGGPVTIYATACDGSGVYGTCQVTVGPPIPVQGVHILDGDFTMYQGETKCPYPLIYPGSASNRAVMWCSSDPSVASVGLYTGEVWAVGPGTATITVTTLDGGFTSSITVTVYIDEVIIRNEETDRFGHHIAVEFKSTGKVWRCVFADLVHSENSSPIETNRAKENYYKDFPNNTVEVKHYSDEELRLLYAIDPYGVADYVKRYAKEFGGDYEGLTYKDRIFGVLFNREPGYFMRDANGKWQVTDYRDNLKYVLSESECLFGEHAIHDFYFLTHILNAVVEFVIGLMPAPIELAVNLVANACLNALIDTNKGPVDVLCEYAFDQGVDEFLNAVDFGWASTFLDLSSLIESVSPAFELKIPFLNGVIDYCLNSVGYNVFVQEAQNSQSLEQIQQMLNESVVNQ